MKRGNKVAPSVKKTKKQNKQPLKIKSSIKAGMSLNDAVTGGVDWVYDPE